jgi:hypothetical protein
MDKPKVQSEEKYFFEYLKSMTPLYGTFGMKHPDRKFLILNENLKVIFRHKPYGGGGNYHPEVEKRVNIIKGNWPVFEDSKKKMNWECARSRTDDSVESLLCTLLTSSTLNWFSFFLDDKGKRTYPIPFENFDVEPSSEEFKNFRIACHCFNNSCNYKDDDIEYEMFTEKGKKEIDNCIVFLKNNTSKTPVQDAWIKVLEKNNRKTHKPFDNWCEIPVMRNIDYSTKEDLEEKRKIDDAEFKKSLTPDMKKFLKDIGEKMKLKE